MKRTFCFMIMHDAANMAERQETRAGKPSFLGPTSAYSQKSRCALQTPWQAPRKNVARVRVHSCAIVCLVYGLASGGTPVHRAALHHRFPSQGAPKENPDRVRVPATRLKLPRRGPSPPKPRD